MTSSTTKAPVTAKDALFTYYDIETLRNVFTLCTFTPRTNAVEVFFLVDPDDADDPQAPTERGSLHAELRAALADGTFVPRAAERIIEANPAYEKLPGTGRPMTFWDLSTWEANLRLAEVFGLSDADMVNDPRAVSAYPARLRPVCDTDPGYDPIQQHAYLAGYNSENYDTTMLALVLMEAFAHSAISKDRGLPEHAGFAPAAAWRLREHNDQLFSDEHRKYMPRYLVDGAVADGMRWRSVPHRIRQSMMNSGRHIDVAQFNESQKHVALKRLLGGLGRQIMESDKLGSHNARITTLEELCELLAYNVSDVVGLHWLLQHPIYSSGFDLKKGLLDEYPETIYDRQRDAYAPDQRPFRIRRGRLKPDSTSAKFVATILSPYGDLKDLEAVSFLYPSERVAKERGIQRVNVLEESRKFFHESIQDEAARAAFEEVYQYYRSIEGKNFNESEEYQKDWGTRLPAMVLKEIPKRPNNLPYYRSDGTPSTCFATFSTGGIHGAEADWDGWREDQRVHASHAAQLELARASYPDARDFVAEAKRQHNELALPDGSSVDKRLVLLGSEPAKVKYRKPKKDDDDQQEQLARAQAQVPEPSELLARQRPKEQELFVVLPDGQVLEGKTVLASATAAGAAYREAPAKKAEALFKANPDGSTKLQPKYVHTSAGLVIHEDFTSYYPNMLRNMSAFYNAELGTDRYAKILEDKDRYQVLKKQAAARGDLVEATRYDVLRNGTKLILNSASGAGDTQHKTPIRVNNQIISMRIIGQLFSWRIGQAQTQAGARIVSTNTDGLYSVLDEETNNRVLAEQQALINVEIEPEPLIIISKDSNNRLELEPPEDPAVPVHKAEIKSASGGSLACHEEPQPTKSLAHPAVIDWALARYLRYVAGEYTPDWRDTPVQLDEPLDRRLGRQLLMEAARDNPPLLAARLFQNVIAASNGMITFPFAADPVDRRDPDADPSVITGARALQHYNRVFFVHDGKRGAVSLRNAGAYVVNAAQKLKRSRDGLNSIETDKVAKGILEHEGWSRDAVDARLNGRKQLPQDQDVAVRRIPSIDPSWSALIENGDFCQMPEEQILELLGCLDIDVYLSMLTTSFEKNWMNRPEDGVSADEDDEKQEDADDE